MRVFIQNSRFIHFICLVFFLFYAFYISHQWAPLLFKLRPYLFWIFSSLTAAFAIALIIFRRHFSKEVSILYIYITAFLLTFSSYQEWMFYLKKEKVLQSKSSFLKELGGHLILGFTDWMEISVLAEKGLIGGIYITARNLQNLSKAQVKEKIDKIQEIRKEKGLPKLFICADQEGGMVSRLSPPLVSQKTLREELDGKKENKKEIIIEYARIQTEELKSIGVNVNFSPVLDIAESESGIHQIHTQIDLRSIGKSVEEVIETSRVFSSIYNEKNLIPTYKHFPGIGKIDTDTHFFTGKHKSNWEELKESDMKPFHVLMKDQHKAWVMLSHTKILDIDPDYPVSFSEKVVGRIRSEIDSEVILVTDDFSMGPSYYFGIEEASERAIMGGVDFLLLSYDKDLLFFLLYHFLENPKPEMIDKLKISKLRIERYLNFLP